MVSGFEANTLPNWASCLWPALMIFFSLIVGAVGGLLAWAGGENPYDSVQASATYFGGTLLLLSAVFYFATHGGPKARR